MNLSISFVSSFSLIFAAVIGLYRIWKVSAAYYPFLFLIWLGLCNEIITYTITNTNSSINTNIYFLFEGILILFFFKQLHFFHKSATLYYLLQCAIIVIWIIEVLQKGIATELASYFIIVHSLVIALLSITMINRQIGYGRKNILKNAIFLICICFIVYFTNAILVEVFYMFNLFSNEFALNIQTILSVINICTNLIYAIAILWIPERQRFSLQSLS